MVKKNSLVGQFDHKKRLKGEFSSPTATAEHGTEMLALPKTAL
jgi:hypothetical protein